MPSKKWDSPMDKKGGYQEFKGMTSGPGVYNNNPLLQKPMTGGFNVKFLETVPRGKEVPWDTPMEKGNPKGSVNVTPPAHSASDNVGAKWDTPFVKGKMKGK